MFLDANDFEPVWRHICTRAKADQEARRLIPSFAGRGGNWVVAVEEERIEVESRKPKGDGFRGLSKPAFRQEWEMLTSHGYSSYVWSQVIWDMFDDYFEDVERKIRGRLCWTRFSSG